MMKQLLVMSLLSILLVDLAYGRFVVPSGLVPHEAKTINLKKSSSSSSEYGQKGSLLNMIAVLYSQQAVTDNDLFEVLLKKFDFAGVAIVRGASNNGRY